MGLAGGEQIRSTAFHHASIPHDTPRTTDRFASAIIGAVVLRHMDAVLLRLDLSADHEWTLGARVTRSTDVGQLSAGRRGLLFRRRHRRHQRRWSHCGKAKITPASTSPHWLCPGPVHGPPGPRSSYGGMGDEPVSQLAAASVVHRKLNQDV